MLRPESHRLRRLQYLDGLGIVDVLVSSESVSLHLEDDRSPVGEQILGDRLDRAERDGGRVDEACCRLSKQGEARTCE